MSKLDAERGRARSAIRRRKSINKVLISIPLQQDFAFTSGRHATLVFKHLTYRYECVIGMGLAPRQRCKHRNNSVWKNVRRSEKTHVEMQDHAPHPIEHCDRNNKISKVFVADDHPVFCEIIKAIIGETKDFVVVGSANNGEGALSALASLEVDLLLLDLLLPELSGLEVLERLKQSGSAVKTIVYSGVISDAVVAGSFSRGACAVLPKSARLDEFWSTLRAVSADKIVISSRSGDVLRNFIKQKTTRENLGQTDLAIVRMLALQRTVKEISADLNMSKSAIYKARTRIMHRLGLNRSDEILECARSLGLIAPAHYPTSNGSGQL